MEQRKVKAFYNEFLDSRMLDYRISGNKRINIAVNRIANYVNKGNNVLDAGCGIGIAAENIAKIVGDDGKVWACDISDKNIWYAQKTISQENISFFEANLIENQEKVSKIIPSSSLDVIYLIDVIEHLPIGKHKKVFQLFKHLLKDRGYIILTYPSPQYQRYLMESKPEELQIIDQVIELDHLREIGNKSGLTIQHYSLEKVWNMHNQYVHLVLQSDNSLWEANDVPEVSFFQKIQNKIKNYNNRFIKYPLRRNIYIKRIFDSK